MTTSIRTLRQPPAGTPMSVSLKSTRQLGTGTWRTYRPKYVTQASPCNLDCPAGTDVRGFLSLAADGEVERAWRTIRERNPLPGICGRVCYHPCEARCNRIAVDASVAVHAVERAIADEARRLRLGPEPAPLVVPPRLVAVVGSGPAGLSCAHHVARLGYGVTVFDAMPRPGGMLRYGIPAYRLPREVLDAEIALLHQMGVNFVCGTRIGAEIDGLGAFDAVFLAVGLWKSRPAGVTGQHLAGVRSGLDFLREVNGRGGDPMTGPVIVIGGGNTALDAARSALRLGASPTIVYRRAREDMPAHPDEIAQAEAEGIGIVFHAAPARFLGQSGRVAAVEFQRMRPGAPDKSGRRRPEPIPGATFVLDAALVLTAIGEELERESLEDAFAVGDGRLLADAWGRTSHQAVFAGGDAATGAGTVVDAIGSGRRAATAIAALFEGRDPVTEAGATRLEASGLNLFYFARSAPARQRLAIRDLPPRTFAEVVGGLAWREAATEAARCLSCGSCTECDNCYVFCPDAAISRDTATGGYSIDFNHCKGCGICAAECPRGALVLVAEDLR